MKVKLTNKETHQSIIIDNTGATCNNDIKIETTDPALLVEYTAYLKLPMGIMNIQQAGYSKYFNPTTGEVERFSDEFIQDKIINSRKLFYDIEILQE